MAGGAWNDRIWDNVLRTVAALVVSGLSGSGAIWLWIRKRRQRRAAHDVAAQHQVELVAAIEKLAKATADSQRWMLWILFAGTTVDENYLSREAAVRRYALQEAIRELRLLEGLEERRRDLRETQKLDQDVFAEEDLQEAARE